MDETYFLQGKSRRRSPLFLKLIRSCCHAEEYLEGDSGDEFAYDEVNTVGMALVWLHFTPLLAHRYQWMTCKNLQVVWPRPLAQMGLIDLDHVQGMKTWRRLCRMLTSQLGK